MLVRIIGGHGGVAPGFRATSYLIDGKLLIDAGSVATGLRISEQVLIDNILISHPHLDHIKDLAFIADNCFGMKGAPFEVHASDTSKNAITTHLMNDMIWPDFSKLPNESNPTIRFHSLKPEEMVEIGGYEILPVGVNHPCDAFGFIIQKGKTAVLFTQDTGPTDRIWELGKKYENLKAIFTEVSFPNSLLQVAIDSYHHTANTLKAEIPKMPTEVPIFLGHLKPNFQDQLIKEIEAIGDERITVMADDDTSYVF